MEETHGEVEITRTDAAIECVGLGEGFAIVVQHGICSGCGTLSFRALYADAMFDIENWAYPSVWEE